MSKSVNASNFTQGIFNIYEMLFDLLIVNQNNVLFQRCLVWAAFHPFHIFLEMLELQY